MSTRRSAAELLPGASLTGAALAAERLVIQRGEGASIWDVDGRRYVDYLLGSGPLVLGHAHPAVVEAVRRQAALGSTFYCLNEPVLELAELMVGHIPCAEAVQFCASGAEATGYALRIARAATGRDAIIKFEGGFHGANDYAVMSLFPSRPPDLPHPEPASAGVPRSLEQEVLVAPFNDLDAVAALLDREGHRVAAIIAEPVQRGIAPVPGFLAGLRSLATKHGAMLILDEIVTGFRLGAGGAQALYGVTPDLATYGKVIGGGYPLAAVAGARELLDLSAPGRGPADGYVFINGTLNGNPVSAAAGLATLRILDEPGAYERLQQLGERMRAGVGEVLGAAGISAQVIGVGPLFQIVVSDEPLLDYRSVQRGDARVVARIAEGLLARGVVMSSGKGYLSLAHGDAEIDQTLDGLAAAAR